MYSTHSHNASSNLQSCSKNKNMSLATDKIVWIYLIDMHTTIKDDDHYPPTNQANWIGQNLANYG